MRLLRLADAARLVVAAACCAAWYGCSLSGVLGKPEPGPYVRLTSTESDEFVQVRLRRRIAIDLADKAGYKWVLAEKPEGKILKRVSYDPAHEWLEGVQMEIAYFYAVGHGITSLRFDQVPDGGGAAIDHFSLTVKVAGDEEFR